MSLRAPVLLLMLALLVMAGCTIGNHGSFVSSSHVPEGTQEEAPPLGPVLGSSCQTIVLYLFPYGKAPTTDQAIQSAKSQKEGTKFLTDISIDARTDIHVGYSTQCIHVSATAH